MKKINFQWIKKIKNVRITKRFVIEAAQTIAILAVFAILGVWYAYGSRAGSSERFVIQYFEYFLTGNYEKMYDMVDVTESPFIDEKYFEQMMDADAIIGGIKDYDIIKKSSHDGMLDYTIEYTKKDGTDGSLDITLEKQPERTYLLFSTWKVNVDSQVIDKFTVGVPSEMTGSIDGVAIDEYYDNTSLDGKMKYYVLLRMFSGEHTFTIAGDNIDTYNQTVYLESGDTEKEFTLDSFSMPPAEEDEVLDYAKYVVNQMYEHALQGADFSDIQDLFADSEKRRAAIEYLYDSMAQWSVGDNGAKLETFSIDKISAKVNSFTYPNEAQIKVTYNYSYTALDERTMLTANQSELNGSGKATAKIYFKRNSKGKWKVIRVVMKFPNYTEQEEE